MSADLERLLPHRPPMVLLDAVHETTADRCVAGWTVPADSPWVENGCLLRAAFIEIAAQTAAVGSAAGGAASGELPRQGYLGGISDFRVHGDARPGDVLRCTARRTAGFGALSRIECLVERVDGDTLTLLAEGCLTVAIAAAHAGPPTRP